MGLQFTVYLSIMHVSLVSQPCLVYFNLKFLLLSILRILYKLKSLQVKILRKLTTEHTLHSRVKLFHNSKPELLFFLKL